MRTGWLALLAAMFLAVSCAAPERAFPPERVLFVGNSLTYTGNLPAVFSALAAADGAPMPSDMIVKPGGTLRERVADGSVARALAGRRYAWLVIQERGGDLVCAFGPDSCVQSRQAIGDLARMAVAKGTKVVLLGTYQPQEQASRHLVERESAAAKEAGIAYAEVSETLRSLRAIAPELAWFAADGVHPGKDLVLLDALRLHQALRGRLPASGELMVRAPIHGNPSGLDETLRASDTPSPRHDTVLEAHYSAETVRKVALGIERASGDGGDAAR